MLAIDTSHLCVLARAAKQLAHQANTMSDAFLELLDVHYCGGQRCALTSETLRHEEQDLSNPDCNILVYADISSDSLDEKLQVWSDYQSHPFANTPVDDRDRTLLAVAHAAATAGHDVVLLTDDMLLYQSGFELGLDDSFAAWTLLSIVFLGWLARCGALDPDDVAAIADAEEDHLNSRHIPPELYQDRYEKLISVVNALGYM